MKKTRELLWMLLAAILLPVALGGCGGGGDDVAKVREVTTDRPTVLLGEMPDLDFMPALERRLTNRTEGEIAEDTEVVVLHDQTIATLTDAQKAGLKRVYEGGGIVILIEPTYDEITEVAGIVGHELAAAMDRGTEHFCDLYAFNGDWHTYVMGHTHADPATDGGDVSSDRTAQEAHHVALMDDLVEWIDEGGPVEKMSPPPRNFGDGGTEKVQELVKAQTVTFNDTFSNSRMSSIGMSRTCTYKNIYFIYAAYDINNDKDYYIVDLQTSINSGLLYVPTWRTMNEESGNKDVYHGYWLSSYGTNHQLEGTPVGGKYIALPLATCHISNSQPTTTEEKQSVTFLQSYSLTGALSFSGKSGSGSVSAGMSFSQSRTINLSDLHIDLLQGQDPVSGAYSNVANAAWLHRVQNLPSLKKSAFDEPVLDKSEPPAISRTTAVFYNNWLWEVEQPEANGGAFNILCTYTPAYTLAHAYSRHIYLVEYWNRELHPEPFTSTSWHIINLTPPPRERSDGE